MATIKLEIVTAETANISGRSNSIVAPGVKGQLGILPHHAPLMTMLQPGEIILKKDGEETFLFVSGGFLEVRPDKSNNTR
jgi:F-type H+-transporting ATPase subunit epsilon